MLLTAKLLCISAQLFMIMDNQNNRINPFVNNEGFSAENNLVDILGNNDDSEGQWRSEGNWRPGAKLNFAPPPSKILKMILKYVYSIQLIMCIIISRSLHVYFTTYDMILKCILTYCHIHVKSALL